MSLKIRVARTYTLTACRTVAACILLGSLALAQPIAFEFGPLAGEVIEWPVTHDLFSGAEVVLSRPTVVVVTSLSPCGNCEFLIAIASSWLERYANVDVILVTRQRQDLATFRRELMDRLPGLKGLTVIADDGAVAEALGFNAQPIIYVVSAAGQVLYRHTGSEIRRLISLDSVIGLANDGELTFPERTPDGSAGSTRSQIPVEWGVFPVGMPAVVLLHSEQCITCRRLAEQGLAIVLNDFANRYPAVQFRVLRETEPDIDATIKVVDTIFGPEARSILEERVDPEANEAESATLVESSLDQRISIVAFDPGASGDPMLLPFIGIGVVPNIYVFDSNGRFVGPEPYWTGPFDAGGLIQFLESTLSSLN